MSNLERYIGAAINDEMAIVANAVSSMRNQILNRSAFKLGTIPGMTTDTAISALLLAARSNGYVQEHGEKATRQVIESGIKNGQRNPRALEDARPHYSQPIAPLRLADAAPPTSATVESRPIVMPQAPHALPTRSHPDEKGEPKFYGYGEEGPPIRSDEIRRQIYKIDGQARRIKIKVKPKSGRSNWFNVYRVVALDGKLGWQYSKPAEYRLISYPPSINPFDPELADDDLYWPEGEKDAETIVRLGALAITFGGTGDGLPEGCESYFAGRNVIILSDNDEGGRAHAEQKAALIQSVAKSARIVHFPELPEKGDVSDWIALGKDRDDLQKRVDETPKWIPPVAADALALPPAKRRLISHRASDIQPERLEWVWPGRIARGKAALLGGPPGLGKSQVTANIAATVSTGGRWPCNEGHAPQGDVVILSAEDGLADTIVPRLIAADADTSRVHIVAAATKLDGTGRKTFSLKTDVDLLEEMSREIGTVRLIIIDPISAYMGGADGNGNVETREVLEPLAEMANRLGIAVVAVTHLNKGGAGGQSALNRFAGSIAFVAAARSAYLIIEDSEDENRRLFLQAKNNLGPKGKGLAFRVEQRLIPGDILASNISWDTDHVTASVDEALMASETRGGGESRSGKDEAADFLRGLLASGAMSVTEIEQEARDAGLLGPDNPISQNKSFRSARDVLGIVPQRKGGTAARGQWVWTLPAIPKMPQKAYDAPFVKEGTLGNSGHLSALEVLPEGSS
jgi:putative DNA primase/helicase